MNLNLLIYPVHAAFWTTFGVADRLAQRGAPAAETATDTVATSTETTAPHSRALLAIHFVAFGVLYMGLGGTIIPNRVPAWFPGQQVAGALIIALGAALMSWARVWFHSWRFRAKLDAGHQLATGGPFRLLRHPIYMGLNLFAIGSAVWDPTLLTWIAAGFMVLGSDLRGRAEERLLTGAFGDTYTAYASRTARFIPGLY